MGKYLKIKNMKSNIKARKPLPENVLSLPTISYKFTKLREKWRHSSISHYLFENQIFLKVKTNISFQVIN